MSNKQATFDSKSLLGQSVDFSKPVMLPVGEATELTVLSFTPLSHEEYAEFLSDEVGDVSHLIMVDQEMWDMFAGA